MSMQPECDQAIDEIVNETICFDEQDIVTINLDRIELSSKIKKNITDEFNSCLKMLEFHTHGYEIFRRWYIDGRLYYHVLIDETAPKDGIKELRYIDPRKIRKVKEVERKPVFGNMGQASEVVTKVKNEYFIFNDRGFTTSGRTSGSSSSGLRVAKDSIVHCVSGLTDDTNTLCLSFLHKSIKNLNQLRTLEDAMVIYRLARAPERRVWYIDVGNLPPTKADQYMREVMLKHKNRLVYDAATGAVRDDRKFMTLLDDYWLARREGGRGTEVTTLKGGDNLSQIEDIKYFQQLFLKTLNVPLDRLDPDTPFSLGRTEEISREEIKFMKFISRLRVKFSELFLKILEKQLVLKGIMSIEDWNEIRPSIIFDYAKDNHYTALKDAEVLQNKLQLMAIADPYVGKYYSNKWVRKEILKQSDIDIESNDEQITKEIESQDPRWFPLFRQMLDQSEEDQPASSDIEDNSDDSKKNEDDGRLHRAKDTYLRLKKQKSLSPSQKFDLRSSVQILAKTKSEKYKDVISNKKNTSQEMNKSNEPNQIAPKETK